jgi:hypothetical protein
VSAIDPPFAIAVIYGNSASDFDVRWSGAAMSQRLRDAPSEHDPTVTI